MQFLIESSMSSYWLLSKPYLTSKVSRQPFAGWLPAYAIVSAIRLLQSIFYFWLIPVHAQNCDSRYSQIDFCIYHGQESRHRLSPRSKQTDSVIRLMLISSITGFRKSMEESRTPPERCPSFALRILLLSFRTTRLGAA